MTQVTVRTGESMFGSEKREAERLGFKLQIAYEVKGPQHAIAARAMPESKHAKVATFNATLKHDQAIEASAQTENGLEVPDVMRDCIRSVLERAKEIV